MAVDRYTRAVLTVIAIALVYLCVVLTPLPAAHAQGGLRPGDDTGPARVVIVGWRTPDRPAIDVAGSVPLQVSGDVQVNGVVETRQASDAASRVIVSGWERNAVFGPKPLVGQPQPLREVGGFGVPVTVYGR